MANYDFLILSPFEFEELSRDILQKHLNIYFESFTTGKDKGIDFRYAKDNRDELIVQCKRYEKYKDLKYNLKKEFFKVEKLNPNRYILSTSVALTPSNKDGIIEILNGYIDKHSDIFGRNDLNNLLGQYPKIEQKYFKLWISSTNIIQKILHNDIINRSEFEETNILKDIKIYVQNNSFNEAIKILNNFNYVIISGIPGIGKTILARILIYKYLSQDYELVSISSDIDEAELLYSKGKKQIFYYDDFLGRNFLEDSLKKNEESRLVRFIEKVKESPNKKFIMTTREYILNQAKRKYDVFDDCKLEIAKCIIDLEKYSKLIKAKILYNHLFYSNLPVGYINVLLINKNYFKIILHKNYSPRIIQFMSDKEKLESIKERDFYEFFMQNLDNPSNIWEHCFEQQISKSSKYLLYKLLIYSDQVFEQDLEKAFWVFYKNESTKFNFGIDPDDFIKSLRELENAFIRVTKVKKRNNVILPDGDKLANLIEFQNPSIRDFLINKVKDNKNLLGSLMDSAVFLNELLNIYRIYSDSKTMKEIMVDDFVSKIFKNIITKFDKLNIINMKSHYDWDGNRFWESIHLNDIGKTYSILNFANLKESSAIANFIIKKLSGYKEKDNIKYCDKKYLLDALIILKNRCDFDIKEYIVKYFSSIEDIDDIVNLIKIKNNITDIFGEIFCKNYDFKDLGERIIDIVTNEYEYISNADKVDIGLIEELKNEIEKIQENFEIDFGEIISDLEYIIEEDVKYQDPGAYMDYAEVQDYYINENEIIDNMFDSLRENNRS